jgi:predicted dehydrogenase
VSIKTYRVVILGYRSRGTAAGIAYRAHPRTEVVALCDVVHKRLDALDDALDDALGVSARFADLDEMIEQTQPGIVAIPVGTKFHHPLRSERQRERRG